METYCKYCGALLEGEVHTFNEDYFCDYDCLESYVVSNTEIYDLNDEKIEYYEEEYIYYE